MNIPKYTESFRNELLLKKYSKNTIDNYSQQIDCFLKSHENFSEPKKISEKEIKKYLLRFKSPSSMGHSLSALKLFYKFTIRQPMKLKYIEYPRKEKKMPVVLSITEVQSMFDHCHNLKHRVILSLLYSCGLRISELLNLKWQDIDRQNNVIHIRQAKGNKDRIVPLNAMLLKLLIDYYRAYKSETYILNGQFDIQYSEKSVANVLNQLAMKAGIKKRIYPHLMRHNCFTHMYEAGVDLARIKEIAGHSNIKTTLIYSHISTAQISNTMTPLNFINF